MVAFEAIERDPNNTVWTARHDGELVGVAQLTLIPNLSHRGASRAQIARSGETTTTSPSGRLRSLRR